MFPSVRKEAYSHPPGMAPRIAPNPPTMYRKQTLIWLWFRIAVFAEPPEDLELYNSVSKKWIHTSS